MQPQPLDYERPTRERKPALRRVFGRIVIGAWALFGAAFVFGVFNSSDRNPLQWPAAMFAAFTLMAAVAVTLFHWVVLVPVLWYRNRKPSR
jgi:hypothetical protein